MGMPFLENPRFSDRPAPPNSRFFQPHITTMESSGVPPLLSAFLFHGAIVIPNNSPLENLCTFALIFLIGALWGHTRCSSRDVRRKELAS